ncbi:hypothetical protein PIB30_103818, partial [Stylosanthes scabra]|nr:hypothetical protein [Stylosanthes scabra]
HQGNVTFESRFGLAKTWPKCEARQDHKLSKQGHVWTKFQTWPKRGSPNPSPRFAEFQRSVNLPVESPKFRKDFRHHTASKNQQKSSLPFDTSARVRGNVCLYKKDVNQHLAAGIEEAEMPKATGKIINHPKNIETITSKAWSKGLTLPSVGC